MKPKKKRKVYDGRKGYPMIRLTGKYLESHGFKVGESIEVEYGKDRITITKEVNDGRPVQ